MDATAEAELWGCFRATMEADRGTRTAAEAQLAAAQTTDPDFALALFRFAAGPAARAPPAATSAPDAVAMNSAVRLAAAVRLKNIIGACNWNGNTAAAALPGPSASVVAPASAAAGGGASRMTQGAKEALRQGLVEALLDPQGIAAATPQVRSLLTVALRQVHAYDWPTGRWAALVPSTLQLLSSALGEVESAAGQVAPATQAAAEAAASGSTRPEADAALDASAAALQRLVVAMRLLVWCCRAAADVVMAPEDEFHAFAAAAAAPIARAVAALHRGAALREAATAAATALGGFQLLAAPGGAAGAALAARLRGIVGLIDEAEYSGLKAFWHLTASRVPGALVAPGAWHGWCSATATTLHGVLAELAAFRAAAGGPLPDATHATAAVTMQSSRPGGAEHRAFFWKKAKRAAAIVHALLQRFAAPRHCEAKLRPVAQAVLHRWAPTLLDACLALVWWHHNDGGADPLGLGCSSRPVPAVPAPAEAAAATALTSLATGAEFPVGAWHVPATTAGGAGEPLGSKALLLSLEALEVAVSIKALYVNCLRPVAESLLAGPLFRRLCVTAEERELFDSNPEEYVRRLADPHGAVLDPKEAARSLVTALCVPTKPFHDAALLGHFGVHVQQTLSGASARLAAKGAGEVAGGSLDSDAAVVDASLYCIAALRSKLPPEWPVLQVLTQAVAPLFDHPLGFLRARAAYTAGVFAHRVTWTDATVYQAFVSAVVKLMADPALPVRLQAAVSLSPLVRHELAVPLVAPRVAEVVQSYFAVMAAGGGANEGVVRTLRRIVKFYKATVAQWAVPLLRMLGERFAGTHADVTRKVDALTASDAATGRAEADELDGDGEHADLVMTGDELLRTMGTMVRAVPPAAAIDEEGGDGRQLYLDLQAAASPTLHAVLSGSNAMGFLEAALPLVAQLVSRSPSLAPETWQLFGALHRIICEQRQLDYFPELLITIDNFLSVDPWTFVSASTAAAAQAAAGGVAAVGPEAPAELVARSPASMLLAMARAVLEAPSLRCREKGAALTALEVMCLNARRVGGEPIGPDGAAPPEPLPSAPRDPVPAAEHAAARTAFADAFVRPALGLAAAAMTERQSKGLPTPPGLWVLVSNVFFAGVRHLSAALPAAALISGLRGQLSYVFSSHSQLLASGAFPTPYALRCHDRRLFIAAVVGVLDSLLLAASAGDSSAQVAVDDFVAEGLPSWVATAVALAQHTAATEAAALQRALEKAAKSGGATAAAEAAVEWEDETDSDEMDSDDSSNLTDASDGPSLTGIDSGDFYEDGDEDGNESGDDANFRGGGANADFAVGDDIRNDDQFVATVNAARRLAQADAAAAAAGLDDDPDEDLLDEVDFESPLDGFDEFAGLRAAFLRCHALAAAGSAPAAALWSQALAAPADPAAAVTNASAPTRPEVKRRLAQAARKRRGKGRRGHHDPQTLDAGEAPLQSLIASDAAGGPVAADSTMDLAAFLDAASKQRAAARARHVIARR